MARASSLGPNADDDSLKLSAIRTKCWLCPEEFSRTSENDSGKFFDNEDTSLASTIKWQEDEKEDLLFWKRKSESKRKKWYGSKW